MTSTTEPEQPAAAPSPEAPTSAPAASTEVVVHETPAMEAARVERMQMQNVAAWGRAMYASNFFPDVKSAAQAVVKILAGRDYGFSVTAAMTGVHIIDGKPVMGAGLMAHAIKASEKYDYRVKAHDDEHCVLIFREREEGGGWYEEDVEYTFAMAVAAGITGRSRKSPDQPSMWEKYPREMLFARAVSRVVAWHCPDVFEGRVYLPDEMAPDLDITPDGTVIDVASIAVEPNLPDEPPDEPAAAPAPEPAAPPAPAVPREPAPDRAPAREPAPPRAREKQKMRAEDVDSVQTLLMWQADHYGLISRQVCDALEVEVIGKIGERYIGKWREAMAMIASWAENLKREQADGPPLEPEPPQSDRQLAEEAARQEADDGEREPES